MLYEQNQGILHSSVSIDRESVCFGEFANRLRLAQNCSCLLA